jgi:hypothetical protein
MISEPIDWESIARKVGSVIGGAQIGGDHLAREALEILIGEEQIRKAVDYYVEWGPANELIRSICWLLAPWSAMQRCYEVFRTETDMDRRLNALDLLVVTADARTIPWVEEFLDHDEIVIQNFGARMLDQLIFSGRVDISDVESLVMKAEQHPNPSVRERIANVRTYHQYK